MCGSLTHLFAVPCSTLSNAKGVEGRLKGKSHRHILHVHILQVFRELAESHPDDGQGSDLWRLQREGGVNPSR